MRNVDVKIIYVIISLVLSVLSFLFSQVKEIEVICCIVFLLCLLCRKKGEGFSVYTILLFTVFLFGVVDILGDLLGIYDISRFTKFSIYKFSDDLLLISIRSVIFFLDGILIAHFIFNQRSDFSYLSLQQKKQSFSPSIKRVMFFVFYVLFIPAVIKSSILVASSYLYGYVASVHLANRLEINGFVNILANSFEILGLLCLYAADDNKKFRKIAILYAIPQVLAILTGQRGPGIIIVITLLWIYNCYYKKINLKTWVIAAVLCLAVVMLVGIDRELANAEGNLIQMVISFVLNQGESFHVLNMTVLFMDNFTNKVPFLFGYFTDIFASGENYTTEAILNKNYLAFHLAYLAYPSAYYSGLTIGTNMIAELYELVGGYYILIMPCSAILMYLCDYFTKNLYKNPVVFAIGFQYIMYFIYSPRSSVGKVISIGMIYIFVFMLVITLLSWITRNKLKAKHNVNQG